MKKTLSVFALLFSLSAHVFAQDVLDIPNLLQLVDYSKSEHQLQTNARNNQATVTANEAANRTLLEKLKNVYRTLQNRYPLLGTAISAANIGLQAEPMVNSIVNS